MKKILKFTEWLSIKENNSYATPSSVNGMGSVTFPGNPGSQGSFSNSIVGSGDIPFLIGDQDNIYDPFFGNNVTKVSKQTPAIEPTPLIFKRKPSNAEPEVLNIRDGIFRGYQKVYDVIFMDDGKEERFKSHTGIRDLLKHPCEVIVENGKAFVSFLKEID